MVSRGLGMVGKDRPGPDNALHLDVLIRGLSGPDVTVAVLDPGGKVITGTQDLSGGSAPAIDPVTLQQASATIASGKSLHWIAQRSDGSRYVVVLMSITTPLSAEFDAATNAKLGASEPHRLEQSESLAGADAALNRDSVFTCCLV